MLTFKRKFRRQRVKEEKIYTSILRPGFYVLLQGEIRFCQDTLCGSLSGSNLYFIVYKLVQYYALTYTIKLNSDTFRGGHHHHHQGRQHHRPKKQRCLLVSVVPCTHHYISGPLSNTELFTSHLPHRHQYVRGLEL